MTSREKNVGTYDRILRAFLASLLLVLGRYWVSLDWQILFYLMALLLIIEAATSSCGLYGLLKINTCERVKTRGQRQTLLAALLFIIVLLVAGSLISSMMTRQAFQDEVLSAQQDLQIALDAANPEAGRDDPISAFESLNSTLRAFVEKYSSYRPVAVRSDPSMDGDLQNMSTIMAAARPHFYSENPESGRIALQPMGPLLQGMLDRNGLG